MVYQSTQVIWLLCQVCCIKSDFYIKSFIIIMKYNIKSFTYFHLSCRFCSGTNEPHDASSSTTSSPFVNRPKLHHPQHPPICEQTQASSKSFLTLATGDRWHKVQTPTIFTFIRIDPCQIYFDNISVSRLSFFYYFQEILHLIFVLL